MTTMLWAKAHPTSKLDAQMLYTGHLTDGDHYQHEQDAKL